MDICLLPFLLSPTYQKAGEDTIPCMNIMGTTKLNLKYKPYKIRVGKI